MWSAAGERGRLPRRLSGGQRAPAAGAVLAWFYLPHRATVVANKAAPRAATRTLFTRPLRLAYSLQIILATTQGVAPSGPSTWPSWRVAAGDWPLVHHLCRAHHSARAHCRTDGGSPRALLVCAVRDRRLWGAFRHLWPAHQSHLAGDPLNPEASPPPLRTAADGLLADATPPDLRGRIQAVYSAAGTGSAFVVATVSGLSTDCIAACPSSWSVVSFWLARLRSSCPASRACSPLAGASATPLSDLPPPAEELARERVVSE